VIGPALLTPLILRFVPTRFLPVLVADYVAAHFALYGALTALGLWLAGARGLPATVRPEALVAAGLAAALYAVGVLGWAVDAFVASFAPGPGRTLIVLAMLAGTVPYFLADEWLTRGQGAARGAYLATKAAFLVSLAIAVALDPGRLFFLVIIVPATVALFLVHGLLSAWIYRRTRHPAPAALANALAFAWALGVTFPLLAG
jgi:hypothetical protein